MDKIKDQNESINEILVNKLYEELKAKNQNIIDTEKERNPLSKTELASNRLILESFIDHIAIEPLSEDFPTNSDVITEEIDQNLIKANFRYMSFSVIAIGGSALIIKAYDRKLKSYVAIKIPRCPVGLDLLNNISYSSDSEINSFELISNEINYIKYFKNENIIKIINHGSFKIKKVAYQDDIYYYIMDYIKESYDLFEFIKFEIHNFKSNPSTTKSEEFLENVLKILQNIFFQISDAIEYLHNEKIIHFDIKPSNIMVKNESPEKVSALLTDFGLAKKYSLSNEEIKVGFTYFYSHKDLKEKMSQMYSINKASAKFKENELKYTWDIYSLGKTIMHCLAYIEDSFPNYVLQDYFFKYLYFASSRMLDGENLNDAEYKIIISKDSYKIVKFNERYMNITNSTFNNIKYLFAYEIKDDISKINKSEKQEYPYMGIEKIFNDIPIIKNAINIFDNREIYKQYEDDLEIYNNSYDSIINQLINADFGGKCSIEKIIELDAFKNLRKIKQLSMVYKTYFNAKHTRYEHSIGVFCCCCKYIERLLKDSTNPIFIQLFNTEDIKILLLGSLLHDLGHYPLAHYIEEFTVNLKHHKRTISICKDIYPTIEEGWGLKNKDKEILFDFLNGGSNIKQKLLYSILDGPIDVDKLDYLYRDAMNLDSSSNRFIKINQEEIIKNLTVKVETINNIGEFRIGLYEDGQAGSDLITFSRYSLYNNVYWNSGSRAYDAMLRTVIQIAHDKEDISEFENKIKNAIDNTFTKKPKDFDYENQFIKELTKGLLNGEDYHNLLDLFFKSIIYKRVLTIHYNEPTLSVSDLLTKFREKHKDITFINKLQDKIYISLITELIVQNFSRIRNDQYNNFIIKIFHELNTSITSYDTLKNNLESYLNNSGTFHEFVRHFSDMSFFEGKELINNLYSYTKSVKNTLLKEKNSKGEETFLTTSKTIKEKLESGIQLQDFNDIFIEECMDRNFVQIALKALISLISSGQETIDELEDTADKINTTFQKKLAIIIDTPYSKIGSEDKIFFIPEPNKLKSNYDIRFSILNRTSEIWEEEIHQKLMSIVAKGRIYCHPDIEEYIMRYLGPTKLKEILIELLQ